MINPSNIVKNSKVVLDSFASVHGIVAGKINAVVQEIADWGVHLLVPLGNKLSINQTLAVELRNEKEELANCCARVVGLVEYNQNINLTLWILDNKLNWRNISRSLSLEPRPKTAHFFSRERRIPRCRLLPRLRSLSEGYAQARVRPLKGSSNVASWARLDPERGILLEWGTGWREMKAPFEINVEGLFSTLTYIGNSMNWEELDPNANALVIRKRQLRRIPIPSGVSAEAYNSSGERFKLELIDISFHTVTVRINRSIKALQPGVRIPDLAVTWKGGPTLRLEAYIQRRHDSNLRGFDLVEIELIDSSHLDYERWHREVEMLAYSTTQSSGHDYESLWELFEESNYFDLSGRDREGLDFQTLRSAFEDSYRKIETAPEVGILVSFRGPSQIEATLTGLRVWSKSWLGLHMARRAARPLANADSAPLLNVHFHVYEQAGANPNIDWMIGYVRDDSSFSKVLHRDYVLSVPGACAVPFEVWKICLPKSGGYPRSFVSEATRDQVVESLIKLQNQRPRAYLESYDLLPETFEQTALRASWSSNGLLRERTALIATEEHTRIVALAVLDAVADGLHLYGMLDAVRLYELEPGGSRHFPELLYVASDWFHDLGKTSFVCFDENDHPEIIRTVGAKSLGTGLVTLLPRTETPGLLERLSELTAPKPQRSLRNEHNKPIDLS